MTTSNRVVRQSVSLSPRTARRVRSIAQSRKASASRVIAELIDAGLDAREAEKQRFFKAADQLSRSTDPREQKRLKEELAHLTFGE